MAEQTAISGSHDDGGKLVLRVVLGVLILFHGAAKILSGPAFILGAAVRFIHYALFQGTLLSPHYYVVDSLVCLAAGFLGFQSERARQMVTQYRWINVRYGAMRWRRKPP